MIAFTPPAVVRGWLEESPVLLALGTSHGLAPEILERADAIVTPSTYLAEVFADPQVRARGMIVETAHPQADTVPLVGSPLKLSATPVEPPRAPPMLGEHTFDVLREAGFSEDEIATLRANGAV